MRILYHPVKRDAIIATDVFLIEPNGNVYSYSPKTRIYTWLFDAADAVDIAASNDRIWISNGHEYIITLDPFTATYNRAITGGGMLTTGLTSISNTILVAERTSYDAQIYKFDITTTTAVPTYVFTMITGSTIAGDIMYNPSLDRYVVTTVRGGLNYITEYESDGTVITDLPCVSSPYGMFEYDSIIHVCTGGGAIYKVIEGAMIPLDSIPITINGAAQRSQNLTVSLTGRPTYTDPFVFTVNVTAGSLYAIPLPFGTSCDFVVDWGDGSATATVTSYTDTDAQHTYTNAGSYQITLTGWLPYFTVDNLSASNKITSVDSWGDCGLLKVNFYGCTSLTTLPTDNTGLRLVHDFTNFLRNCTSASLVIPDDIFKNSPYARTIYGCFYGTNHYTNDIPSDIFENNTNVYDFSYAFYGTDITSIPEDLFRHNIYATTFVSVFNYTQITSIPDNLFLYNVNTINIGSAFANTSITAIPAELLYTNTKITGVVALFRGCTSITAIDGDFFSNNTLITSFQEIFYNCTILETAPAGLFNFSASYIFTNTFYGCTRLQVDKNLFYADGEQSTRFYNLTPQFTSAFQRSSFDGTQGEAPDLWNCDFGEIITINVSPTTDWAAGDIITGQTSAATCEVVSKITALTYYVKKHYGTYTAAEVIGVTGNADKLADQNTGAPTFAKTPNSTNCFDGAGNSITSLSNYASIPTSWT